PHSGLAQLGQRLGCGRATRAAEVREGVAQVARDVEGLTALGEDQRSSDSIRTVTEQRHDFVQWPQVKFAVRILHPMRAIERRPMTDRDHDVEQPVQLAPVIMDISSCTDGKLQGASDVDQGASERHVPPDPVSLDLDEKPVSPEDFLAMLGESASGADPLALQCPRQQSVATPPGENDQPVVPRLEGRELKSWVESLGVEVRLGEEPAKICVPLRRLSEQNEMTAIGEGDLGTGDCLQAERLGGLREPERAVDAVAIR